MAANEITVVFAHGAWADGSSWSKVVVALHQANIRSVTAPLPLTTFENDVNALNQTVKRVQGPVILVGHAYGGAVIGAADGTSVKGLVYVAGLAPDEGEPVAAVYYRGDPHPMAPKLAPDEDGLIWLPDDAFESAFAHQASPSEQVVLRAVQRPISPACITVPVGKPLWKDHPSWYLLAEEDRMIVKETQRFVAERMRANIRSFPVDHTPSVSAPKTVVDIVLEAVKAASTID
jgi:pimeloyl-ACP methyl ester carboxylesterase